MRIALKEMPSVTFGCRNRSWGSMGSDQLFIGEQARESLRSAARHLPVPGQGGKRTAKVFMINDELSGEDLSRFLGLLNPMCFFSPLDVEDLFFSYIEGADGADQLRQNGLWNIIPLMIEEGPVPIGIAYFGDRWRISRRLLKDNDVALDCIEAGSVLLLKT